ncbi:MAG: NAD-dependent epimerase/dehydratase family protein [Candidatus ainarchaeum sp.]|nr:NAD-dependent epimerase/dehydratase family protein [Candidatus ainarchaeum sp.]
MKLENERILVTGGAGFIGSELCARLLARGNEVVCFDNFSSGKEEFIAPMMKNKKFKLIRGDMLKPAEVARALGGCRAVIHLAANPDVRLGQSDTRVHFEQNVVATFNLLEAMKAGGQEHIVFASSSVVYGAAKVMPTPEGYGPLLPVSLYGASKLACEAMVSAYSDNFGFSATLLRYANVIGRHAHGVTRDFRMKLEKDPSRLEILGDGTQTKSYLHVSDCVEATILAAENTEKVEAFNVGSEDKLNVKDIADIVSGEMGLRGVKYEFTGGQAWKGDIRLMLLSIEKMGKLGWKPRMGSREAVQKAVREMLGKE